MMPMLLVGVAVIAAVAAGGYYLSTQKNSSASPSPAVTVRPTLAIASPSTRASIALPTPTAEPTAVESPTAGTSGGPGGKLVFTDDFSDSTTGWSTETLQSGTKRQYATGGFVFTAVGALDHFGDAPWSTAYDQLAISTTATEAGNKTSGTGFGVSCLAGSGASQISYEFLLYSDGGWAISRHVGSDSSSAPDLLKEGSGSIKAGSTPATVEAVCMKVDATTVRLVMAINDSNVADVSDTPPSLPTDGFTTSIEVSSVAANTAAKPVIVTFTKFQEWDLSQ